MTPSKTLFLFCITFVLGIFLQSVIKIPQTFLWGFLIIGFLTILISLWFTPTPKKNFGVVGFCILFFLLGIIRIQIIDFNILNDKLSKFNDKSEKITLVGQIIGEPDIREKIQRLKVKISLRESLQVQKDTDSIILVTIGRYPEYKFLDKIKITGNLKTPIAMEGFNYKNYLLKDGIYSVMDFPKIELVTKDHSYNLYSKFYEKVLNLKKRLIKSIDYHFSTPENFIIYGVVLGNDKNTPKDLKDKFSVTGLSHITAVSGGNIVILINLLVPLLLILGFWRGQAFYFSIFFIWFYILLTGLPISGIRAVIMGSAFLLAEKLGRKSDSSRIIIFTATIMLIQNPLLLIYDIGFQLSFLASMGIIYLKPIIDNLIKLNQKEYVLLKNDVNENKWENTKKVIYKKANYLLDIISVTLSAQIFVLPIIIYNFGNISLVAPITNLLILPIIPYLMIFGFASAILGIFSNFLGWVFYLPCFILLKYFLGIIDIFYTSWSVKTISNVSVIWIVIYYIILSILSWHFNRKLAKFLEY